MSKNAGSAGGTPLAVTQEDCLVPSTVKKAFCNLVKAYFLVTVACTARKDLVQRLVYQLLQQLQNQAVYLDCSCFLKQRKWQQSNFKMLVFHHRCGLINRVH